MPTIQPQNIIIAADIPIQVPVQSGGITLVNQGAQTLTLSGSQDMTNPVTLGPGVCMPWNSGTTVWVNSPIAYPDLLVLPGMFNYYDPNIISVVPSGVKVLNEQPVPGTATFTAPETFQGLIVGLLANAAGSTLNVTVYGSGGIVSQPTTVVANQGPFLDKYFGKVEIPIVCNEGDLISLSFENTGSIYSVAVYGNTETNVVDVRQASGESLLVRSSGGSSVASGSLIGSVSPPYIAQSVLTAPPTGKVYLLHALNVVNISVAGGSSGLALLGPNANPYPPNYCAANLSAGNLFYPLSGLLVDSAIEFVNFCGNTDELAYSLSYDIVDAPITNLY